MKPLTIEQLAKRADACVETEKFYERKELLEEPKRRASSYRQYDRDVVRWLELLHNAKNSNFVPVSVMETSVVIGQC